MKRRLFVATITSISVSAGLAGCTETGLIDGDGTGITTTNDDPETVITDFYSAMNDGDAETANSYLHPDGEVEPVSEETAAKAEREGIEVEVTNTTVVEENDQKVVVETVVQTTTDVRSNEVAYEMTLRRHNSQWKIYNDNEI